MRISKRTLSTLVVVLAAAFALLATAYTDNDDTYALVFRIIVIVSSFVSIIVLLGGFIRYRSYWNEKTRDYWFGRIFWCIAGVVSCSESIIRHTPFRYGTIFFVVAAVVTLKGVMTKGTWGTPPEAIKKNHLGEKRTG